MPAQRNGNTPRLPRIEGFMSLESSSPNSPPRIEHSRVVSICLVAGNNISTAYAQGACCQRDTRAFNILESVNIGYNNGRSSSTGGTMSVGNISAATPQALQGVEVNELCGLVNTLARQAQTLKAPKKSGTPLVQRERGACKGSGAGPWRADGGENQT
ncbi:hypothetical protein EDD21DRAFT_354594 [Dissophora ornata]|nr:hypothetical protein EDD21DRAFT_354594 [Dissophora ornata]